jgi:hypothetical protein
VAVAIQRNFRELRRGREGEMGRGGDGAIACEVTIKLSKNLARVSRMASIGTIMFYPP